MKRIALVFLAAVPIVMVASSAEAAVTVGQTVTPNSSCGGDIFQRSSLTTQYSVPSPGVLTHWSFEATSSPPPVRFKVARQINATDYTIVGASSIVDPPPSVVSTYDTRISVQTGDQIGFYTGSGPCALLSPSGNFIAFSDNVDDEPVGTNFPFTTQDQRLLDISAQLEPDADNDGFGDETQDKCLGTPGASSGCPSTVTIDGLRHKGGRNVKVTVTVPGAGTLTAGSSSDPALASAAAKKSLKAVTQTLTATTIQQLTLKLRLTKSAIAKLSESGKLKVKVKAVYTPPGGPPGSQASKLKLKS